VAVPEGVVSAVGGISGSVQLRACREGITDWRSQDSVLVKNFFYTPDFTQVPLQLSCADS